MTKDLEQRIAAWKQIGSSDVLESMSACAEIKDVDLYCEDLCDDLITERQRLLDERKELVEWLKGLITWYKTQDVKVAHVAVLVAVLDKLGEE